MDSLEMDPVKAEKANAMRRYRRIRQIATGFRYIEACLVLFFLSWFSARLPTALKISGDFFRKLFVVLISPLFVFLVGNAIVITLFAKSRHFSGQNPAGNPYGIDLYDEFLKNSENRHAITADVTVPEEEKDIVYEDKSVVWAERDVTYTDTGSDTNRAYRRSWSENLAAGKGGERELRRSETDIVRKLEKSGNERADLEAEMSSEEFRRTIDAFIENQLRRFQREESIAIVVKNQN